MASFDATSLLVAGVAVFIGTRVLNYFAYAKVNPAVFTVLRGSCVSDDSCSKPDTFRD